ncbi:cryptopain precursor, putative [Perkinsus marinus ATCC 50983]|uniref:Cryptopain, putative n=1 Tax=Perkinsus marinus (strain ATCC 50983 / TXsc) TaxID=423536 RepID=C5M127_PERM5|nr:cryptopain precursor, putative [Perkinsus marinus ATCC 50983]EEQ97257.1 cryptopain precursor, putative [Perkinsus marinus ATCC 50983]|eukprot:XP_002764540.1 cryptopain precursor, putative [Perkinsus marinus ATCC 50983]
MATIGAMEGAFQIKTGHLAKFSAQQIVDCSMPWGNNGCVGGSISKTATYVNLNGIVSDKDYPYVAKKQDCNGVVYDFDKACLEPGDLVVRASVIIPKERLDILIQELQFGPIALTLFANTPAFINYRSGILDIPDCKGEPHHAMLLVGYGFDGGKAYWLLQDTYGPQRGENGYIRVARDPTKTHGPGFCNMLLDTAFRPVLNKVLKSKACLG